MSPPPSFALDQEAPAPPQLPVGVRRAFVGVVAASCAVLGGLALYSYRLGAADSANAIGRLGHYTSFAVTQLVGRFAWCVPAEFLWLSVRMLRGRPFALGERSAAHAILIAIPIGVACTLQAISWPDALAFGAPAGGAIGSLFAELAVCVANPTGAWAIGVCACLACLVARTGLDIRAALFDTRTTVAELAQRQQPAAALPPAQEPAPLALPAPRPPARIVLPATPRSGSSAPRRGTCNGQPYQLPPTSLLERGELACQVDRARIQHTAEAIADKLQAHGLTTRVDEVFPGPVVSTYELIVDSAVKVSKIAGLADDLAMGLAADTVRVLAPIPGKARVGLEVPNADRQVVPLRPLLESERWHSSAAALPLALGTDTAGQPLIADLAEMPHLLVAGATGAGKSVGLNAMLASLLYRRTPDELRLILIDAKVVEFGAYADVPHLYVPVVTEVRHACAALAWAAREMEERYDVLAAAGVRNIDSYNARTRERMPRIVIVVDELADLLSHKEIRAHVELCIGRLAQKARAAGLHLILATQRPSVDVITGTIKANFPARIAFKVSQPQDSQTIIGKSGADKLLGSGDMLLRLGDSSLRRVHGAFISEDEVAALCAHLCKQAEPTYDESLLLAADNERESAEITVSEVQPPALPASTTDAQYESAVRYVEEHGECSISQLQRLLGMGYDKAKRLMSRLEEDGVVGAGGGQRRGAGRRRAG